MNLQPNFVATESITSITRIKDIQPKIVRKALAKALAEIEKSGSTQVNIINKQNPTKTIFAVMGKIQTKRNLKIFTVD